MSSRLQQQPKAAKLTRTLTELAIAAARLRCSSKVDTVVSSTSSNLRERLRGRALRRIGAVLLATLLREGEVVAVDDGVDFDILMGRVVDSG